MPTSFCDYASAEVIALLTRCLGLTHPEISVEACQCDDGTPYLSFDNPIEPFGGGTLSLRVAPEDAPRAGWKATLVGESLRDEVIATGPTADAVMCELIARLSVHNTLLPPLDQEAAPNVIARWLAGFGRRVRARAA